MRVMDACGGTQQSKGNEGSDMCAAVCLLVHALCVCVHFSRSCESGNASSLIHDANTRATTIEEAGRALATWIGMVKVWSSAAADAPTATPHQRDEQPLTTCALP